MVLTVQEKRKHNLLTLLIYYIRVVLVWCLQDATESPTYTWVFPSGGFGALQTLPFLRQCGLETTWRHWLKSKIAQYTCAACFYFMFY